MKWFAICQGLLLMSPLINGRAIENVRSYFTGVCLLVETCLLTVGILNKGFIVMVY